VADLRGAPDLHGSIRTRELVEEKVKGEEEEEKGGERSG